MKVFLCLFMLCQIPILDEETKERPCIITSSNIESKMLLNDIKIYTEKNYPDKMQHDEDLRYLEYIAEQFTKRCMIINDLDLKMLEYYRVSNPKSYPCIKFRKYGDLEYLPKDIVLERTFTLLTLKSVFDEYYDRDGRVSIWSRKCSLVRQGDEIRYERGIIDYIVNNLPPDEDLVYYSGTTDINIQHYERLYSYDDKFPKQTKSPMPPKFRHKLPWEAGYTYTPITFEYIGRKATYGDCLLCP